MDGINIFFSEDTELSEFEAANKCYRCDVYVKVDNKVYNVNIYNPIRLQQDFEAELESNGYYYTDPNLILVKNCDKSEIIYTINKLNTCGYFNELKPNDGVDISKLIRVQ